MHVRQLVLCGQFQRLVALHGLRTPGLDEKPIGGSDLILSCILAKPKNLQSFAASTLQAPFIKYAAARANVHLAR
jgi:hypothetical protein